MRLIEPLIRDEKADAIRSYLSIANRAGLVGSLAFLGLTGLPLATIGLTIVFSVLALLTSPSTEFIELAKLTLGAFIGSFVQRQVEKGQQDMQP